MFCPNCGTKIEGSDKFCPSCGSQIYAPPPPPVVQKPAEPVSYAPPVSAKPAEPVSYAPPVPATVPVELQPIPKAEPHPKPPKKGVWKTALLIAAASLCLLLIGLCVFEYTVILDREDTISSQADVITERNASVAELNGRVDRMTGEISSLNSDLLRLDGELKLANTEIAAQLDTIAQNEDKIEELGKIITDKQVTIHNPNSSVLTYKPGYDIYTSMMTALTPNGQTHFRVSKNIIVMRRSSNGEIITLTTMFNRSSTIKFTTSGSSASMKFASNSWKSTVDLTIKPKRAGVTLFTFTNSVDSTTFQILVLVYD